MTIPANYGEFSFIHTGGGIEGEAVCTLGFANTTDKSAVACAEDGYLAWANVVEGSMIEDIVFTSCKVKLGPDDTGDFAEFAGSVIGDQGNDAAGPQVAILVSKVTGVGGRKGRGRCFLPGPPDVLDTSTGEYDPAFVLQVQGVMDALLTELDTQDLPAHLLHSTPGFPFPITGFVVRTRSGTQRRRNRR